MKQDTPRCLPFLESFVNQEYRTTLKRLSNLLLIQLENWLVSPQFYKDVLSKEDKNIKLLIRSATKNYNERITDLDYNLFRNLQISD